MRKFRTLYLILGLLIAQSCVARELAVRCHRVFGCRGMSRVDMIVGRDRLWVLEVNTMVTPVPVIVALPSAEKSPLSR